MASHDTHLTTPIYLKTRPDMPRPPDRVAYVLGGNGLFLTRRHPWLGESCVPAQTWPCELERHSPYLIPAFPLIPQYLIERLVGFFDFVGTRYGGEAICLLVWDQTRNRYRALVPSQVATIGLLHSNRTFPVGVEYQSPTCLPHDWSIVGDVHSHVDAPAYTSGVDRDDEAHSSGLHIIVGRIDHEPPQITVTAVVDGYRFELRQSDAIADYQKRRWRVPRSWSDRVRVRVVWRSGGYDAPRQTTIASSTNSQELPRGSSHEQPNGRCGPPTS
jgi:proteasome lid subunit RPN8/RPN11